jgi:hypothetical protein
MSSYHDNAGWIIEQNYQRRQAKQAPKPDAVTADTKETSDDFKEERSTRLPTSTRRYTMVSQRPIEVSRALVPVRSGKTTAEYQAPSKQQPKPRHRGKHWLWYVGISALISWFLYSVAMGPGAAWWTTHNNDVTYGFPRTYQTDAVIGHSDDKAHPTHFLAVNLRGEIIVFELPGNDPNHGQQYDVTRMVGTDAADFPVTLTFKDLNGDGKLDMIVQIVGGQPFAYINDGSKFRPVTADDKLNTN